MRIQGAKNIVTGLATTGLIIIGTVSAITGLMGEKVLYLGVEVLSLGVIFMLSATSFILVYTCVYTGKIGWIINLMPMPGVKCPTCLESGIEQWVLPGKHCPNCSTACRNLPDLIISSIYLYFYGYISAGFLFYIILLIL